MKALVALAAIGLVAACATPRSQQTRLESRGQELAVAHCGACHATGLSDESRAPEAPALRHLSQNYRVAALEEALAKGISIGHPAMPEFQFAPEDVDALIAYLQSIQVRQ